ncbi:MAG: hypothetical protein WC998_05255 [Candidatus Paceibacterota bacterium]|jgi:hypothetical protein
MKRMKRIEVTALIRNLEVIEVLQGSKFNDKSFELRPVRGGMIMSLIPDDTGRYSPHPYAGSFRMEMTEGKSEDDNVTVICGHDGEKIEPYWVRNERSQRSVDPGVDLRFSVRELACIVTLDKVGRFTVSKARIKNHLDYIEIQEEELFSADINIIGGKFLLSKNMFADSDQRKFTEVAMAAVCKANFRDGGGPMFFVEKKPSVVFHEVQPQGTMASTEKFSRGMSMVSSQV